MSHSLVRLAFFAVLMLSGWACAATVEVTEPHPLPLGQAAGYLLETGRPLSLMQAEAARERGDFKPSSATVLSFGLGSKPVWVSLDLHNAMPTAVTRRLTLATSWLDHVGVHLVQDGRQLASWQMGDTLADAERPVDSRYFAVDLQIPPGISRLYLRVDTPDPMVLPITLQTIEQAHAQDSTESLTYGLLYGGLFSLLCYNLMLYFSLGRRRYLYFALYLAVFSLANAAYTGHGFRWLWPDAPHWQQWGNPLLVAAYQVAGVLFATTFLRTAVMLPRLHRGVTGMTAGMAVLTLGSALLGAQVASLVFSLGGVFLFSCAMVLLGAVSLRTGNKSAKYFLLASITHVTTASVTSLVVWGFVPYSQLAYRAVEIGMLLDAILLAMALADEFRISQAQKAQAERLARVDPLTGMNNRRAFYEQLQPRWANGLRKQHAMTVIVLDIDHFKAFNDSHGHAFGDQVLREVAAVLQAGAREGDILARWGGEEFILFLDETTLADGVHTAERLRNAIAAMVLTAGDTVTAITASFGVAEAEADGGNGTIDDLVTRADRYLYLAKAQGRNRVCAASLDEVA